MDNKLDGQLLGHRLTPEGWKELRWRGKEVVEDPLDKIPLDEALEPLHKKFREVHREALNLLFAAVNHIKEGGRQCPMLREEALTKLNLKKQTIKDLILFGLIQQEVIPIENGKIKLGSRAVLVPTLEARKLMRSTERALLETLNVAERDSEGKRRIEEREPGVNSSIETGREKIARDVEVSSGIDCQEDACERREDGSTQL